MAEDNKVLVKFGVQLDELFTGLTQAKTAVKDQTDQMKSSLEGLAGGFGQLKTALIGFSVLLGGGSIFSAGVNAARELTSETMKLSKSLGITTTEASTMNVALKMVGLTADVYAGANMRLTRQLKTNEDGLKAMGVVTRDSNGELKNGEAIMTSALTALKGYKEGTDRNLAAQSLFGRGAAEATALMKLNNEVMEKAKIKAEELGLVIGPQQAGNTKAYNDAMNEVRLVLTGIQNTIGQALMPVLTTLANWFSDSGPQRVKVMVIVMDAVADVFRIVIDTAVSLKQVIVGSFARIAESIGLGGKEGITVMQVLANVMNLVKIAVLALELGFVIAFEVIAGALEVGMAVLRRYAAVAVAALHFDWGGIKAAWSSGTQDVENIINASGERIIAKSADVADKMKRAAMGESLDDGKKYKEAAKGKTGKSFTQPEDPDKGKNKADPTDKSQLSKWEAINAADKAHYEMANNLRLRDLSLDVAYWNARAEQAAKTEAAAVAMGEAGVKNAKVAHEDKLKALAKAAAAELEIMKKQAADGKALSDEAISESEKVALHGLALTKQQADSELALGNIKAAKMIEIERSMEDERFKILVNAQLLRQMLVEDDPNHTPAALQKEKNKLLEIERTHALKVATLTSSAMMESTKAQRAFFTSVQDGMTGLVDGILAGTTKMSGLLMGAFGVLRSAFASLASDMIKNWIVAEASKSAASATGAAVRGGIETGAAAMSVATTTGATLKNIMMYAWEAMAAAYKSVAAIPIIGPVLAPVAAGVAFAGVATMAKSVMSARGGFDIPAGMNPITQLHEKEMVLPEQQADAVRRMADGGGGGQAPIHIHGSPDDTVKVKDMARLLKTMNRNFAFV